MKRTVSVSCILLALAFLFATLGAVAAGAQTLGFTKETVTAYVFDLEQTQEIECLFLDDLPDVPYLQPVDYLNVIYLDPFTVDSNGNGVYTVTNAYNETMVIDAENDTIYFEFYNYFFNCEINQEGNSVDIDYVKVDSSYEVIGPDPITLDLAAYGIDIIEDEGKVYLPLTILAAMFSMTYNNALYLDGCICFVHTFDPECYYYEMDLSFLYQETERSEEMAAFSYNSLCFSIDYFFGKPSSTPLAELLKDHTLDEALATFGEETQIARDLLLSTSLIDYMNGFMILGYYLYDGGHTVLTNIPIGSYSYYNDSPLMSAWFEELMKPEPIPDLAWECYKTVANSYLLSYDLISGTREAEYAKYEDEIVAGWASGAYLIIHEDTAVFVFDSFEVDTPDEFKEALDIADEAGVKVFILDDTCNGGGYVAACNYIVSVISNSLLDNPIVTEYSENPLTGAVTGVDYVFDLNLDGVFDAEDQNVKYDFEFAVLTSQVAFSCGNRLPIACAELGVLVMGEPSGGGSCIVSERYTAEGYNFPISDIDKSYSPAGIDYDLGAPVEYYLAELDDNFNWDYTGFYDLDYLTLLAKHYYEGTPIVWEGFRANWSTDSGTEDLTFVSSADINDFECVKVDGKIVDPANYYVEAGSTIVTLRSGYLWSLSRGEHTITIVSSTGEAEAPFTVDNILSNPITGDDGHFGLWVALIVLSVCGIGVVLISCRTKKSSI